MLFVLALEVLKLIRGLLLTVSLLAAMAVAALMIFSPLMAAVLRTR